ncbi:MAG: helix-turn-helix domain-containing protein [Lachnospiraceae bacterium]|nr:helix-turn-helix domain-containing protein [Lachnospiraceae bacterium]
MITKQTIRHSIEELASITGTAITVYDLKDEIIARAGETGNKKGRDSEKRPVEDDEQVRYFLSVSGKNAEMVAQIAVSQLHELLIAYQDRFDRNNFFQNLLLDNLLLVDIYNRAKKLRIEDVVRRVIYLIEVGSVEDTAAIDYLNGMFTPGSGDYVTAVDETSAIVVKALAEDDTEADMEAVAESIVAMLNTEAMIPARVAYGTPVNELKDLSKSYKEAMLALEVGRIFYAESTVNAYNTLGIGRLIYQLPANLCRMFINEVFGDRLPLELDEETRITIDQFFENDLNVSETARKLFVHRNTLVYRIDRLQKEIGLDIRDFDDALTLKISLMVDSYLKYLDGKGF